MNVSWFELRSEEWVRESAMRREENSFGVPHPHVSSLAYNCLTLRTNGKTPRYETMYVEYGLVPWAPLMQMLQTAMHSIQARAAQCCRLTWISPVLSMSLTSLLCVWRLSSTTLFVLSSHHHHSILFRPNTNE